MVKCPKCGFEIAHPRKCWKMAGRPNKSGIITELTVGLFDCSSCSSSFKAVLGKKRIVKESNNMDNKNRDTKKRIMSKSLALRERFNIEEVQHIKNSLKKKK